MSNRSKVILSIIALAVAYAFGRFQAPEKVVTITKTIEVEKKSEKTSQDHKLHETRTTTTITKPDGTKESTTTVTYDSEDKSKSSKKDDKFVQKDEKKEVTNSSSKTTVSVLGGINLFSPVPLPDYGLSVSRPVIGPLAIGIFGFRSGMLGCSVGLSF